MCESLSFTHICSSCQDAFLSPSIYKRKLKNNIEVISFYKYKDIKKLLHTKHTNLGYYIYNILAQNSLKIFAQELQYPYKSASIPIDDKTKSGYSHTAILNKYLKTTYIKPYFAKLRAKNDISYSRKSKEFRMLNPREFIFKDFTESEVILVDDIITTGSTLTQASEVMKKNNKEVLFCLTLADASVN
jgi:competence protein ComFC